MHDVDAPIRRTTLPELAGDTATLIGNVEVPIEFGRRDSATRSESRTSTRRAPRIRLRTVGADILFVVVVAGLMFALWPTRLGGATTYVLVEGTSMQPKFHTGDLAIVREQSSYQIGDIVAYRVPKGHTVSGRMIIHRIVGRRGDAFVTRGDNRTTDDPWYPRAGDVVGRFRVLVPIPGVQFWTLLPWAFCALVGIAVTVLLWPHTKGDDGDDGVEPADRAMDAEPGLSRQARREGQRARRRQVLHVAGGLAGLVAVVSVSLRIG
jgi:signal peptidase I